MFNGLHELADRMFLCSRPKIFCRDMQVDLSTCDLFVAKQIANRDEVGSGPNKVRRERVSKSVWRHTLGDLGSVAPGANPFVDGPTRHAVVASTAEERCPGCCRSTVMSVIRHCFYHARVERHAAFVPALADDGNRAQLEIDVAFGKR